MPSADYVTYETSNQGNTKQSAGLCGGTRFQNVRIIQQTGERGTAVLQSTSPLLTSAQEQIMQAEILFEAPSTAEASLV